MKNYKDLTREQKVVFDFIRYGSEGDFIQRGTKLIMRLSERGTSLPRCGIYENEDTDGLNVNIFEAVEFLFK